VGSSDGGVAAAAQRHMLMHGSRQFFRLVFMSPTTVEVTGSPPHRVLEWESVSQQARGADIESHLAHFRGLPGLLKVG
jgi:hypothetical protein